MKKIIRNIITMSILVIISSLAVSTNVMAGSGTCIKSGCTRKATPGPDRDGYCYEHSPKNNAVRCKSAGCTNNAYHGKSYCDMHKCGATSCNNKKMDGIGFCSQHKSYQSYYTNSSKKKTTYTSSSSKKKSTSTKSSSSKKKYNMPDCDDYDSYDDFMDDWDGCMPDGSDAEDYWENW